MTEQRRPQRFRYRYDDRWQHGVCTPDGEEWQIQTDSGGSCSFYEDPWESLGVVLGDVEAFEWIDHDYDWPGNVAASSGADRPADRYDIADDVAGDLEIQFGMMDGTIQCRREDIIAAIRKYA